MTEVFVYVVTDDYRKIRRNITGSVWSAQTHINDLVDRAILAGYEVIETGVETVCEEWGVSLILFFLNYEYCDSAVSQSLYIINN